MLAALAPASTAIAAVNKGAIMKSSVYLPGIAARSAVSSSSRGGASNPSSNMPKRNFIRVVRQGEMGYRLFLGRNPTKMEPGIHLVLPVIHSFMRVDMREAGIPVGHLHACTKDNVPVVITGTLFYRIHDPYAACFQVQNVLDSITYVGTSCVRSVIGTLHYDDIISDRNQINTMLKTTIGDSIATWGASCTKFEIQLFEPQNDQIKRQLELQMEAERRRRQQELDTRANVNIAEGAKQSAILKSEGETQAKKNLADAEFYVAQRKADGLRYTLEAEASAWRAQVERLNDVVRGDPVEFMLEWKRLHNMQAIAEGPNNTTYFLPANSIVPESKVFADIFHASAKQSPKPTSAASASYSSPADAHTASADHSQHRPAAVSQRAAQFQSHADAAVKRATAELKSKYSDYVTHSLPPTSQQN